MVSGMSPCPFRGRASNSRPVGGRQPERQPLPASQPGCLPFGPLAGRHPWTSLWSSPGRWNVRRLAESEHPAAWTQHAHGEWSPQHRTPSRRATTPPGHQASSRHTRHRRAGPRGSGRTPPETTRRPPVQPTRPHAYRPQVPDPPVLKGESSDRSWTNHERGVRQPPRYPEGPVPTSQTDRPTFPPLSVCGRGRPDGVPPLRGPGPSPPSRRPAPDGRTGWAEQPVAGCWRPGCTQGGRRCHPCRAAGR